MPKDFPEITALGTTHDGTNANLAALRAITGYDRIRSEMRQSRYNGSARRKQRLPMDEETARDGRMVHFLWPPFLFAFLSRQPARVLRAQMDSLVHNLPYT